MKNLQGIFIILLLFGTNCLFSKNSQEFVRYQANIVMSELFYDLSLYDSYRASAYDSLAYFEDGSFAVVLAEGEKVLKGKYMWRRPARTFNKCLPYAFSVPESFPYLAAVATKETLPEGQKFIPLPEAPPVPSSS